MSERPHEHPDELDALAAAWRDLEAPADLDERQAADPETRACVDWMARAWEALEAPALPALPVAGPQRMRPRLRNRVLLRALPFAAAALAIALLQTRQSAPNAPGGQTEMARAEPPAAKPIRPVFHDDGSVETRYGNVRLILVPDSTTEAERLGPSSPGSTPETSTEKPR